MLLRTIRVELVIVIVLFAILVAPSPALFAQADRLEAAITSMQVEKATLDQFLAGVPDAQCPALVDTLITHLQSSDWVRQANAAYVLGGMGQKAAPAIPHLIRAMDAQMANVSWEVIPALAKIGPAAVPALISELKACAALGTSLNRRTIHAIQAVGGLGPIARDAVPLVVPFLYDGANNESLKTLLAIGPSCLPAVCQGLDTDEGRIPVYAAQLLSQMQPAATSQLVAYVRTASARGRKHAAWVFANLKPPAGVEAAPSLCQFLADRDLSVVSDAATALKAMGPAAVPDVAELLASSNDAARQQATDILRSYGVAAKPALGALERMMAGTDLETTTLAAATILKIDSGHKKALEMLTGLLRSADAAKRSLALRSFSLAGPGAEAAVTDMTKALCDPNLGVRLQAAQTLGEVGPGARTAVSELAKALSLKHLPHNRGNERLGDDANMYRYVLEALGKIGPDAAAAVPQLVAILEDETRSYLDEYVYQALTSMKGAAVPAVPALSKKLSISNPLLAIETLAAIGAAAKSAVPDLERLLEARDSSSRQAAFKALMVIEAGQPKQQELAKRFAQDPEVSTLAMAALSQLPSISAEAVQILLAEFKTRDPYDPRILDVIKALGNAGPAAVEALPKLIKDNTGSSFSPTVKEVAFAAIKKIDPTGEKTMAIVQAALEDPFQVRGSVELLEFIGSPPCQELARTTRVRWKF